jgi:hypothetical protein
MRAICPRSASSGHRAEFHEGCYQKHTNPLNCRTGRSDISGYNAEVREGCYQKHTSPLKCRTSSSDIFGFYADFHEGHCTAGEWQGRGLACVNYAVDAQPLGIGKEKDVS